ncbi:MAG: hypothetical protein O2931_05865 [Planctomycetota bacterium]|nr:hypothetical protein [Planctomycetota bacterium]MDA1178310.1 hypothetical protein [Planctomycetota bacterium]
MNMRFILALVLMMTMMSTGCRSPRMFGWRGANCGWQPRGLLRRRQPEPAFQPAGCGPECGSPNVSGYPGEMPGFSESAVIEPGIDGVAIGDDAGGPVSYLPSGGFVPSSESGPVISRASLSTGEIAMGPEYGTVPLSP